MTCVKNIALAMLIMVSALFVLKNSAFAAEDKIAVFPFEINSEKNMSFLQKGISDMLYSRLSTVKPEIILIKRSNASNRDDMLTLAKEKNATFAVSGSVVIFGNTVNTTAFLYNVETGQEIIAFNKSDSNKDDLFSTLKVFADEVVLKTQGTNVKVVVDSPKITNTAETETVLQSAVSKSRIIKADVNSITAGDVNGDGVNEIIFTDKNNLYIASFLKGKFTIQKTIKIKHYLSNIAVDIYDENKNGVAEIFVTALRGKTNSLKSYVVEWNGTDYQKIMSKAEWFFSVKPQQSGNGYQLTGQKQHFADKIFSNYVYLLSKEKPKRTFQKYDKIDIPSGTNIYDFTYGDVMNTGTRNLVSYTSGGYVAVYDEQKTELWKSSSRFGGSMKYLETRKNEMVQRVYLPHRIIAEDIDGDSITEIVTVVNSNSAPRALVNLKNYKDGHITCLSWNNLNFEPEWQTQSVSGYISDFTISDLDKNGTKELIYSVVTKAGKFWKSRQTYFVIQSLPTSKIK